MTKFLNFFFVQRIDPFLSGPFLIFNTPFSTEYHPALSFPLGTAQPDKSLPVKIGLSFGSASTETDKLIKAANKTNLDFISERITQRNL